MKFKITMKDPDGVYESIQEAVSESLKGMELLSNEELEALEEARKQEIHRVIGQWFEYSEYLTVEIDTEAKTCTVVKTD